MRNTPRKWGSATFNCVGQGTAATLFRTSFIPQIMPEAEATDACLQDRPADTDAAAMMAGFRIDAPPAKTDALIEFLYAAPAGFSELAEGTTTRDEITLWSFCNEGWVSTAPAVPDGVVYVGSDAHLRNAAPMLTCATPRCRSSPPWTPKPAK